MFARPNHKNTKRDGLLGCISRFLRFRTQDAELRIFELHEGGVWTVLDSVRIQSNRHGCPTQIQLGFTLKAAFKGYRQTKTHAFDPKMAPTCSQHGQNAWVVKGSLQAWWCLSGFIMSPPFQGRCSVEGVWPGLPFNMFAFLRRLNDGKCLLPRHVAACGRGCDGKQQMLRGWESSLS